MKVLLSVVCLLLVNVSRAQLDIDYDSFTRAHLTLTEEGTTDFGRIQFFNRNVLDNPSWTIAARTGFGTAFFNLFYSDGSNGINRFSMTGFGATTINHERRLPPLLSEPFANLALTINNLSVDNGFPRNGIKFNSGAYQGVILESQGDFTFQKAFNNSLDPEFATLFAGGFSNISDKRMKRNIRYITPENAAPYLEQIRAIESATYFYQNEAASRRKLPHIGVIAQSLPPNLVTKMPLYQHDQTKKEILTVSLSDWLGLVTVGVKENDRRLLAKEQEIAAQNSKIEALESEVAELKQLVQQLLTKPAPPKEETLVLSAQALLAQNQPNPFSEQTLIRYTVPANVQRAQIRISTADGRVLANYPIEQVGEGELTLGAGTLPAGTYFYSLLLDGQVQQTHRMVLTYR